MNQYLVEVDGHNREAEAIRRLLELPFVANGIFEPLGLFSYFSWYVLQIPQNRLVTGFEGDVDILAGPLAWSEQQQFNALVAANLKNDPDFHPTQNYHLAAVELAESGGIMWPPSLDRIVAIEAKCAYFDNRSNQIKSLKSSSGKTRHIRDQVQRLFEMGFDAVALLDLIANPPASGLDGQAWLAASKLATTSLERMSGVLKQRLRDDCPAGHFALSMGAVVGGNETMRGSGYPLMLQPPGENDLLTTRATQECRRQLENNLRIILERVPTPRSFPVILDATLSTRVN